MALLEDLNKCSEAEVDTLISNAIKKTEISSEKVATIGLLDKFNRVSLYRGFITAETRIGFNNSYPNDYSMRTTDYFYEFAKIIKNLNLKHKGEIFEPLQNFINNYFGILTTTEDLRADYFETIAFTTTKTDSEYFEKLKSFEIGDFKGKNIAMCTERTALAQNIISLFGHDTYFCMGCLNINGKDEPHAFNVVKGHNIYGIFDFTNPRIIIDGNEEIYSPYVGSIKPEELDQFLNNNSQITFTVNGKKRTYVVGVNETKKEETIK